jgi:hypothetical protein
MALVSTSILSLQQQQQQQRQQQQRQSQGFGVCAGIQRRADMLLAADNCLSAGCMVGGHSAQAGPPSAPQLPRITHT